jgi:ribonuclease PH
VEIQGTAENKPFTQEQMAQMLDCGSRGIHQILAEIKSKIFQDLVP